MPTNRTSAIQGQRFARMGCSLTTRGTYSSCRSSNAERPLLALTADISGASAIVSEGSVLGDGRSASRSGCGLVDAPRPAPVAAAPEPAATLDAAGPVSGWARSWLVSKVGSRAAAGKGDA